MTDVTTNPKTALTPRQRFLSDLWDRHLQHEFADHDTQDALATMISGAHVNHVPVLTGGRDKAELRRFYSTHFIPALPPDMDFVEVSRTIGVDRLAFEFVATFTHSVELPWMLPGVPPPTGRRVEMAAVAARPRLGRAASTAAPSRYGSARTRAGARRYRRCRPASWTTVAATSSPGRWANCCCGVRR